MSDDWIEEDALRFEGFNQTEIDQIKVAIPKAQQLMELLQKHQDLIDQSTALVKELVPTLNMVTTKLKARMS